MISFYIKRAFQHFNSTRLITIGSFLSLVLGVLSAFFIYKWVANELTMDRYHENADRIFIIVEKKQLGDLELFISNPNNRIDFDQYPEIDKSVTVRKYSKESSTVVYNSRGINAEALVTDSTFFDIFDFPLQSGDGGKMLADPGNIILTRDLAQKIFGKENPIGKSLTIQGEFRIPITYAVAGIIEEVPSNSSIQFDFILPSHSAKFGIPGAEFLLVNEHFEAVEFNKKIAKARRENPNDQESTLSVIPLSSVYFDHYFFNWSPFDKYGDEKIIILFTIIGVIVFLVSLLNFINLQTTAFTFRLKGTAINKVNGASWFDAIKQIVVERILIVLFASAAIVFLYYLLLPWFNQFISLNVPFLLVKDSLTVIGIATMFILISVLISLLQLRRFNVLEAIKNQTSGSFRVLGKESMIVFQYVFTIAALIASIVVFRQLHFMLDKDLGFEEDNIISVSFFKDINYSSEVNNLSGSYEKAKNELDLIMKRGSNYSFVRGEINKNPDIEISSKGMLPFVRDPGKMLWKKTDSSSDYSGTKGYGVAPGYEKLLDLEILEGRFFDEKRDTDKQQKVVINEAAKRLLEIEDISCSPITIAGRSEGESSFEILGVVKDFHYEHLSFKIEPLVMVYYDEEKEPFLMKIRKGREEEVLTFLDELYSKVNPIGSMEYTFLDEEIRAQYKKEEQVSQLYLLFTAIGLFISSIGLYTMSLYQAQKRVKEIGVRRVNGASVTNIMFLLNKDFLKWILFAFIIASPIAWYSMDQWLQNFAYKIELSWWIFALAGVFALAIGLLTVSLQSWWGASRNPVESLKYE